MRSIQYLAVYRSDSASNVESHSETDAVPDPDPDGAAHSEPHHLAIGRTVSGTDRVSDHHSLDDAHRRPLTEPDHTALAESERISYGETYGITIHSDIATVGGANHKSSGCWRGYRVVRGDRAPTAGRPRRRG